MQIYHFQGQNMYSCKKGMLNIVQFKKKLTWLNPSHTIIEFFCLTIKSRFMVLFWNIMSWFHYKLEVSTPEVLYYVKKLHWEKTWLLCFKRYSYFCYHATLVDVKRKRTRKGEMKLAMSSICNTQKYWIVADESLSVM